MRVLSMLIVLSGAGCAIALIPQHASAATSPAMQACSQQWSDMKKANKVPEGEKWSTFWSQCSKDFAAKNGGDTATEKKVTTTATPAKTKTKTASISEDDSPSSAQQKRDCDGKWGAYKTKTGAHGWHDYFHFMAQCM
jgi:hypothetical protein